MNSISPSESLPARRRVRPGRDQAVTLPILKGIGKIIKTAKECGGRQGREGDRSCCNRYDLETHQTRFGNPSQKTSYPVSGYLYFTRQIEKAPDTENKENLLRLIAAHSPMSWDHINMLGEYDFLEEKLRDILGILSLKSVA